jgi:hypothetical protein
MQDFTETSASSISLGSCQEYYRDLPDQFDIDLFTSTATTESDDTDNNNSTRELKVAAPNNMLPLTCTPPRFKEFEHSTLTPVTLATTFAVSSSSLDDNDNYNELPVPPLIVSHSLLPSCPPEQPVGTIPVPFEGDQCRIKGKSDHVPVMRLPFVILLVVHCCSNCCMWLKPFFFLLSVGN